jgi:hypothetical protein
MREAWCPRVTVPPGATSPGERTVSGFADALEAEALDAARLEEAAAARVRSSERLKAAVVKALGRIHAVLDPEQRKQFAFLIRTGAVQF